MNDTQARRVGRVTLIGFALGPILILVALLVSSELPHLLDGLWYPAAAFAVSALSYGVASLAAHGHMTHAAYLNDADRRGWDDRGVTKVGFLVPFIYLLTRPEDRQVGHSRKSKVV
jgi:hypothetical protein